MRAALTRSIQRSPCSVFKWLWILFCELNPLLLNADLLSLSKSWIQNQQRTNKLTDFTIFSALHFHAVADCKPAINWQLILSPGLLVNKSRWICSITLWTLLTHQGPKHLHGLDGGWSCHCSHIIFANSVLKTKSIFGCFEKLIHTLLKTALKVHYA